MTSPAHPVDDVVTLPGRPRLAVRRHAAIGADARLAPFLLVHGLASNARLWDGVAVRLAQAGHDVVAVDLRGCGRSPEVDNGGPDDGYDTETCADDLAALVAVLGGPEPIVAGQSWGAHVALSLAARHPGVVRALACVDGGWLRLREAFATFDDCWAQLAPPRFEGLTWAELRARIEAGHADGWPTGAADAVLANLRPTDTGGVRAVLTRERHRAILRSLYAEDTAALHRRIDVPVLLLATVGVTPTPGESPRTTATRAHVVEALATLPDAVARWYPGAHHDVHLQRPAEVAADLRDLAARAAGNLGEPL